MRAHYLQHVPFEGLGHISSWLHRSRAAVTCTKFYQSPELPDPKGIDLLIVVGGPMSVNDRAAFPWLVAEKAFIHEAIDCGTAVLGVCLGAQLIAAVMGARVYPHTEPEIGWFPVFRVPTAERSVFRFPPALMVFHWHGETFDMPAGAVPLARSFACEHQAFQLGDRVMGLQFHLETTEALARGMIIQAGQLGPSRFVQSREEILGVPGDAYSAMHSVMNDVLDFVVRE